VGAAAGRRSVDGSRALTVGFVRRASTWSSTLGPIRSSSASRPCCVPVLLSAPALGREFHDRREDSPMTRRRGAQPRTGWQRLFTATRARFEKSLTPSLSSLYTICRLLSRVVRHERSGRLWTARPGRGRRGKAAVRTTYHRTAQGRRDVGAGRRAGPCGVRSPT